VRVETHPEAEVELARLRRRSLAEYQAMFTAIGKLEDIGAELPFPHSSQVRGTNLRELRPRGGRSAWRAFYRRVGDVLVIGAIGPEAEHNPRGFRRAVNQAISRLKAM
jgi:hypothetical protein